jgi:CRISPR-associated protein Cmr4
MQEDGKFPQCAGQGGHCGRPDCPVCVTFGFAGTQNGSFQGLAQFSDARLLFFPVHSLAGPVWVTCADALGSAGIKDPPKIDNDDKVRVAGGVQQSGKLNLGWLMLEVVSNSFSPDTSKLPKVPQEILDHAVLVSNKMFSHIVNDNLEVRTSVSIDPQTGAAAEGALFTYEALPRASVLVLEVVVSDPKFYKIGNQTPLQNNGGKQKVIQTVEKGLALFASLGIGGMNTRGMGRLCVLNLNAGGAQ